MTRYDTVKHTYAMTLNEAAHVLAQIPKVLPEGVWLSDMTVYYGNKTSDFSPTSVNAMPASDAQTDLISVELSGYAYANDSNQQFKKVYALVNVLKSDKVLNRYFRNANLASIQNERNQDSIVTSFRIVCK